MEMLERGLLFSMFNKFDRVVCIGFEDLFIQVNRIAYIRRSKFVFLVIFSELTVQMCNG
jgi:hypothetical protein